MCGINGIVRLGPGSPPIDRDEVIRTRNAMTSRGPDDAGAWISQHASLAGRRLAIQDLSTAGRQPLATPDGRFQIVMNGEIYNFRALRQELAGHGVNFHSKTDTEVVLYLYLREGPAMLSRLRGMFGLAIWDDDERRLFLARDPLGIKPLYYAVDPSDGSGGGLLRFASQVKALEAGGALPDRVDPAGLAGFLLWGSVPEPFTIRRAIRALPAGSFLTVEDGRVGAPVRYRPADREMEPLEPAAALDDAVRSHLISDVPVAVFLSAGLDSGLIAALARRHLAEPPATFTLRFDVLDGTPRDEGPLAAAVARALGTHHIERRVGRADFAALWPAALAAMDQPSIDGFNTWLVSKAAHEAGLKVVLSGLGGDELFGSYPSFHDVPALARAARRAARVPGLAAAWPALARLSPAGPKLRGLLRYGRTLPGAYFLRRGLFLPEELPALIGEDRAAAALAAYDPVADAAAALADAGKAGEGEPWTAVHALETALYMRNQLLRDADWASMAHSVELRVPLVDVRLRAHLAARGFEPAKSRGKAALVRQAAPELPEALWSRPKSGFYIPVMEWLEPGRPRRGRRDLGGQSRRLALRVLAEMGL